ncbi:hypothetical protein JCM3765_004962 [Sporobolomyces pararoseus]
MPIYAFGSNEHYQVDPRAPLHLKSPLGIENSSTVVAASWSQVVTEDDTRETQLRGLPLENSSFDITTVKTWLGQDEFVAVLLRDGTIRRLKDGASSEAKYHSASMNSRGEILVVTNEEPTTLLHFPSLSSFFASTENDELQPSTLPLPFYPSNPSNPEHISLLASGASHFLVLALPSSRLFSLGDNRYGQLGVPQNQTSSASSTPTLHRIDAFDGLRITQISAGAFHSVVLTEGGQVYFFGSDQKNQCGGTGGGWDPSVNETIEGDGEDEIDGREGDDVVQVCAFGESTILRTRAGEIWVTGASQLGLSSSEDSQKTFVKHSAFGPREKDMAKERIGTVKNVVCSRWTTYLEVDEHAT